jgi:hypothetical protein
MEISVPNNNPGALRTGRSKHHVYNLTHNFGHGKQHLSALLVPLNLLAFVFHTLLELLDSSY